MGLMDRILGRRSPEGRHVPAVPSHISSFVAVMSAEREDGDDLCERLLDQGTSRLDGRPRRHGIDSRSWYSFRQVDSPEDPFPEVEKIGRGRRPRGWSERFTPLLEWMTERSGVEVEEAALEVESFYYDHLPGSLFAVWKDEPPLAETTLVCRGCGFVFDFAQGAGMITDEDTVAAWTSAGLEARVHSRRMECPCPDLVVAERDAGNAPGIRDYVFDAVREGWYRRWRCARCNRVQGYPGSLLLRR